MDCVVISTMAISCFNKDLLHISITYHCYVGFGILPQTIGLLAPTSLKNDWSSSSITCCNTYEKEVCV